MNGQEGREEEGIRRARDICKESEHNERPVDEIISGDTDIVY